MGNTTNGGTPATNKHNKEARFSKIYTSTKISIPNEQKRNDQIAEDQISICELFISPNKEICIIILKEKTFTGDLKPIYYINIYYYDAHKCQFIIVLNHIISSEINQIDAVIYDPNNNYILMYNKLSQSFYLFKFEFITNQNPKLGMNHYNMSTILHPHINFFDKCCYITFLKKGNEILFVFEKGYFILLTFDNITQQYDIINYFSSRSSYKTLYNYKKLKKKQKRSRGYKVIAASVHETRDRIIWIECEYNHYYLQILSLKCILNNKRVSASVSASATVSKSKSKHSNSNEFSISTSTPINLPESTPSSFAIISSICLNDNNVSPISTNTNGSDVSTPSLSSISKKHIQQQQSQQQSQPIKITPISINISEYLIVSRLIFANQKDMFSIRDIFDKTYDLTSRKLYFPSSQFNNNPQFNSDYGATKFRGVIRKKTKYNKKYILDEFFGINPLCIKLLFNRNGDKILYQSSGNMLHHTYGQSLSHGDQYAGNLNDFGGLHVIDVTTGNSIWSLGSSSKDIGYGWFNNYLMVLPSEKSASGLAATRSIYNPHNNKHRSLSMSASMSNNKYKINIGTVTSMSNKKKNNINCKANISRMKHSNLMCWGFISETAIAETIYNQCNKYKYISKFSWDLCVEVATFCGGMREYRQISMAKYQLKKSSKMVNKYQINDIKLINNQILSIWNVNDNYYNLNKHESRSWLIIAIKEYRDTLRYIDIMFYDSEQIAMHKQDIFIPYFNDDGLICRNLLSKSSKFDPLYHVN